MNPQDRPLAIFLGPSLELGAARAELDAWYLPPVSQGDVYAVARRRPRAIGIVDGYFEHVPAVWHKEILWALAQGIHVFGASSMGALRAAKLDTYGMVGVGRIFETYRSGALQDDDEVAVIHGPAESGYLPLSEAMVDLRATLTAALAAGLLGPAEHERLVALAKARFYPERSYPALLAAAAEDPGLRAAGTRLAAWLPAGKVRQKRDDALALLRLLRERQHEWAEPKQVRFFFHHTSLFEALRRQGERRLDQPDLEPASHLPDAITEEARLQGAAAALDLERARSRALALLLAEREQLPAPPAARAAAEADLRRRLALDDQEKLRAWLEGQQLDPQGLGRLLDAQGQAERVFTLADSLVGDSLHDLLRLDGRYAALAARGLAKHRELGRRGLATPALNDAGLDDTQLWHWYFVERQGPSAGQNQPGAEVPADLEAHAARAGFPGLDAFRQAALREFLFVRILAGDRLELSLEIDPV